MCNDSHDDPLMKIMMPCSDANVVSETLTALQNSVVGGLYACGLDTPFTTIYERQERCTATAEAAGVLSFQSCGVESCLATTCDQLSWPLHRPDSDMALQSWRRHCQVGPTYLLIALFWRRRRWTSGLSSGTPFSAGMLRRTPALQIR